MLHFLGSMGVFLNQVGWIGFPILGTIFSAWSLLIYKGLFLKSEAKKVAIWESEGLPQAASPVKLFYADRVQQWQAGLSTLHTLGSLLPMLGLLGTVTGIITVFNALGYGSADPEAIGKGIGEALVSTQLGLFGAIPTLFGYTALCNKADQVAHRLKRVCEGTLEMIDV